MSQWNFNNDNEWYTREEDVENLLDKWDLDKRYTIWCPFDTEESAFYKVLTRRGHQVILSHIDEGRDFYTYKPKKHYDFIMSNPPFKGKAKLIERLLELNKPFALIFGIQCFNSGEFVALLSKVKNLKMIFCQRRMKFHKGDESIKLPAPTFHSMWITSNIDSWASNKIDFILIDKEKDKQRKEEQKIVDDILKHQKAQRKSIKRKINGR